MKKWWIGYTGADGKVEEVEVVGTRDTGTEWESPVVRLADGTIEDAARESVFDTEAEAQRGRVVREAEMLEENAEHNEEYANRRQLELEKELAVVAERRAKIAEDRARAKALRDALAEASEVKDATEGWR